MPVATPAYRPPPGFGHPHLQTLWPALFRRVPRLTTRRERLELTDGDFLDLDWFTENPAPALAVLTHGLEGNATNSYIQGMARALARRGWNVLAWNLRGCSGELNRLAGSYHSGASADLRNVLAAVPARFRRIAVIGFSLGGNLTLRALGEPGLDPRVAAGVAISVPCDLASSAERLADPANQLYMENFLRAIRRKILAKAERFPDRIPLDGLAALRTFREIDDRYTAPLHGFRDADDYWTRASSRPLLPEIRTRTLVLNAADDPFLGPGCFPHRECAANDSVTLEVPARGGHLGFLAFNRHREYWVETRVAEFLGPA
jgi:hypothetical protein